MPMAFSTRWRAAATLANTLIVVATMCVSALEPKPSTEDCVVILEKAINCLSYLSPGVTSTYPGKACCDEVNNIKGSYSGSYCLCELLADTNLSPLPVDPGKAWQLSSSCGIQESPAESCTLIGVPIQAPPGPEPVASPPVWVPSPSPSHWTPTPSPSHWAPTPSPSSSPSPSPTPSPSPLPSPSPTPSPSPLSPSPSPPPSPTPPPSPPQSPPPPPPPGGASSIGHFSLASVVGVTISFLLPSLVSF